MKVLLLNGSPREEGCTYMALSEVARTLQKEGIETEIFWIGKKAIGGCIACYKCKETKRCVVEGGVNEFRELATNADGFIFGTPVHYAGASGNITSFLDRLFYSTGLSGKRDTFRLKPASNVAIARRGGTSTALDQLNKYQTINEMFVVSSTYWNMVHGAMPEEVAQDKEGLHTMRVLARNMAYLLKCQEAGKSVGIDKPEAEPKEWTNFIR
jgi:multimeric flavodoxin WrbA